MHDNETSDLSLKLRLTMAALGCAGMKELSARFHAVNPRTHFEIDRAQKWMQGRAIPRSSEVYADWAALLNTRQTPGWIASCSIDAFLGELHLLFGIPPEALRERARPHRHPGGIAAAWSAAAHGYLCGAYACYSLAWSPYFRGQLIRGALLVEAAASRTRRFAATYSEHLLGRGVEFQGEVLVAGRALHIDLREPETSSALLISLALPGPPASIFCGVMSGSTVVGPDPEPSATRFVMVRVKAAPAPSNRYLEPAEGAIAQDLEALGLCIADREEADALIRRFLMPADAAPLMQVSALEQGRLTPVFDRAYLAASGAPEPGAEPDAPA